MAPRRLNLASKFARLLMRLIEVSANIDDWGKRKLVRAKLVSRIGPFPLGSRQERTCNVLQKLFPKNVFLKLNLS